MNKLLLAFALSLPLVGCVGTADLLSLEQRITDRLIEGDDDAVSILKEEMAETAEDVEGRIESALEKGAAAGGLVGLLSTLGLNIYRNKTRKVQTEAAQASQS